MSQKRNQNKKAWNKRKRLVTRPHRRTPPPRTPSRLIRPGQLRVPERPPHDEALGELNQVSVVVTEEQLGLEATDRVARRAMLADLPSEPTLRLLSQLAARAEKARSATAQIRLAEEFFGQTMLVRAFREVLRTCFRMEESERAARISGHGFAV